MAELVPDSVANGAQLAATEAPRRIVPLVCHGHTRPVTHLCFTHIMNGNYHLVSSSKDGIPMFRDGRTGDWQGSWMGHQGAIWCARPSDDGTRAASASADFTARVWDAATGELLYTLTNKHVVRAVDFCPSNNDLLITASNDGALRLWNLALIGEPKSDNPNGVRDPVEGHWEKGQNQYVFTIGQHQPTTLKFALWLGSSMDRVNRSIVTAQGKRLFWWELQDIGPNDNTKPWKEHSFDNEITCCEKFDLDPSYAEATDIGGGKQVFGVAAGKTVVFWGGEKCDQLLKQFDLDWRVSSIAIDVKNRKFLAGQADSTWAVMLDWDTAKEEQVFKSHHGPIHSMSFSPDNKIFATGSEDGTVRIWKNCEEDYGLWQSKKSES